MGAPQYKHKVLEYFTNHPGMVVHSTEIQEACDITHEQVINALYALRKKSDGFAVALQAVIPGRSWMYHPNLGQQNRQVVTQPVHRTLGAPKVQPTPYDSQTHEIVVPQDFSEKPRVAPVGDAFERVGRTDDGEVVVKDKKGTLYKVVRL